MTGRYKKLQHVIKARLSVLGLTSTVKIKHIRKTKLCRVIVVSDGFEPLRYTERQNLVWTIAREVLIPEQLQYIAMIWTLTEDEIGDQEEDL